MRFQVTHTTKYLYGAPVFLEPHTLRLRPRCDPGQRLQQFALTIQPQPQGTVDIIDLDGNLAAVAWFHGVTDSLRITSRFTVDTLRSNPFDFIMTDPLVLSLPSRYPAELEGRLAPYLRREPSAAALDPFVEKTRAECNDNALEFLTLLCRRIQKMCRSVIRQEGPPRPAAVTLENREGACRDLAVLFIEACRCVGLAARFVSGYQDGEDDPSPQSLHAWAEVYLPGGSWRGYDPSIGLVVADRHVALATGPTPGAAAPVSGTFRGTSAQSSMSTEIRLQTDGASFAATSQSQTSSS